MSTLVDHQIRRLADLNKAIVPYNESQLNPASYNLTIGTRGIIEMPHGFEEIDLRGNFSLAPGGWILVDVQEVIRVPPNHEAQVILRSSAARRGWDHALAGYIDPGYKGRLTLEFVNCLRHHPLPIKTGMELVQLKFSALRGSPERDYSTTGRYYDADHVEGCKDSTI